MKNLTYLVLVLFFLSGCKVNVLEEEFESSLIISSGQTLETRISVPDGFVRKDAEEGSLTNFLRKYSMKDSGAPLLLHNGKNKSNQNAHAAIFNLPIENENLQQCADSVIRVYAEYFWSTRQKEKIAFHFTDGFLCEYLKWEQGFRPVIDDGVTRWSKTAGVDSSYQNFVKYLRTVFSYAGTLSMEAYETETISLSEMTVGDVIIKGGSPGHVVMVVDVCENERGEKAFLLAQGYMPAQEFHVIKNPLHEDDMWYYEKEIIFPLNTAEYTFENDKMIKRVNYSEIN